MPVFRSAFNQPSWQFGPISFLMRFYVLLLKLHLPSGLRLQQTVWARNDIPKSGSHIKKASTILTPHTELFTWLYLYPIRLYAGREIWGERVRWRNSHPSHESERIFFLYYIADRLQKTFTMGYGYISIFYIDTHFVCFYDRPVDVST